MKSHSFDQSRPLVVDLDGTLIRTDMLVECANQFLLHHPFQLFKLLWWLFRGKTVFKAKLAKKVTIDVSVLPYNRELLDWLQTGVRRQAPESNVAAQFASVRHHTNELPCSCNSLPPLSHDETSFCRSPRRGPRRPRLRSCTAAVGMLPARKRNTLGRSQRRCLHLNYGTPCVAPLLQSLAPPRAKQRRGAGQSLPAHVLA